MSGQTGQTGRENRPLVWIDNTLEESHEYTYDYRGCLTEEEIEDYTANTTVTKTYGYDLFRRLTSFSDGTTTASYEYNADNLRTAKTVGNTRTDYVWDGTDLMYEYGGAAGSYAYDMTGVIQNGTDTYLKDEHGSVIGKYSSSSGISAGEAIYDAFGNKIIGSINDPFGYCGEYLDSESGLIYLRNRYYAPSIGRFITEDPARDGLNWYVYCENNPLMLVDPDGLYDREAAVKYAIKYAKPTSKENLEYDKTYNAPNVRFNQDCTNFVSFCLYKGGNMGQTDDWFYNWAAGNGKYITGSWSDTWTNSEEQFKAFTNCTGEFPDSKFADGIAICIHESKWIPATIKKYNIRKGDILYFQNPKTMQMGHTAIIVSTDNGVIKYAQHDSDKNDGNLNEYLNKKGNDPNEFTYVYVVRISDDA